MTDESRLDPYLDSLRNDLPTARDEARIRRRLIVAGLGVTSTFVSQTAAAATPTLSKAGLWTVASLRFANLPLLAQMGLVTATTALLATTPVLMVAEYRKAANAQQSADIGAQTQRLISSPTAVAVTSETTNRLPTTAVVNPSNRAASDDTTLPQVSETTKTNTTRFVRPLTTNDTNTSSLAEETKLIDAALAAIRDGRFTPATNLLNVHRQRFPNGRLTLERQRAEQKLHDAHLRNGP
jgi:TolA-binding protein